MYIYICSLFRLSCQPWMICTRQQLRTIESNFAILHNVKKKRKNILKSKATDFGPNMGSGFIWMYNYQTIKTCCRLINLRVQNVGVVHGPLWFLSYIIPNIGWLQPFFFSFHFSFSFHIYIFLGLFMMIIWI